MTTVSACDDICIDVQNNINSTEFISTDEVGTFTDLQNEVNYAISNNKSLELKKNYVYNENNNFDEGVLINGSLEINGNDHIIDAKGQSRIFKLLSSDNVIMNNIIFINGNSLDINGSGGAIYNNCLKLIINNCTFINNTAIGGGAIKAISDLDVNYCEFYNNTAIKSAGAVQGTKENKVNVFNSLFINNNASIYGGAICGSYAYLTVDKSYFINNSVINKGGAICVACSGAISNSVFENNFAESGGAAINAATNTTTIISKCYIKNNNATTGAGVRVGTNSILYILDTSFISNDAINGSAIYASKNTLVSLFGNYFDENIASSEYIIYNDAHMSISNSKVGSFEGYIYNNGCLLSNTVINILDNSTFYTLSGKNIKLYATISVDNMPVVGGNFNFIIDDNSIEAINEGSYFIANYTFRNDIVVSAKYNEAFNPTILNGNIKSMIGTMINASDLVVVAYDTKNLVITLEDNEGNVLVNKQVVFNLNGKNYSKTTTIDGKASIPITSSNVGSFNVGINFDGDNKYTGSNKTVKVTVKPTYVTIKQIITAANYLKNYGKKYKKLPTTVKIGSVKCSIAQASYLMTAAYKYYVVYKKSINTKIKVINVKATAKNTKGEIKSYKKSYTKIFNSLYSKGVKGSLPITIKVNGKTVGFNQYTFALAKVISFSKLKYRLPNYVIFSGKYIVYTKGL